MDRSDHVGPLGIIGVDGSSIPVVSSQSVKSIAICIRRVDSDWITWIVWITLGRLELIGVDGSSIPVVSSQSVKSITICICCIDSDWITWIVWITDGPALDIWILVLMDHQFLLFPHSLLSHHHLYLLC